jgi:hypothetical protein
VLLGQCLRSNAGLYYANATEFAAVLERLLDDRAMAAWLGRNGRIFYEQNYSWPVIERKYLDMLARLTAEPPRHQMEKLPGWIARRQQSLRAAAQILDELPSGPVVESRDAPRGTAMRGAIA